MQHCNREKLLTKIFLLIFLRKIFLVKNAIVFLKKFVGVF
jgi:hypothetical protein